MLLRRITTHVKAQNWFAVGLDFLIVIVGVFIGLQVSNWNEERTDAMREKVILADLLEDLNADKASLSTALELLTLGIDAGNTVLIAAEFEPIQSVSVPGISSVFASDTLEVAPPSTLNGDNQAHLWSYSTLRIYPTHNDATIESLIAADNSSIIEDSTLVRELLRYRSLWAGVEDAQINTFRPLRDRTVFAGHKHGFSPLTPVDYDLLIEAVRNDASLLGALRTMVAYSITQRAFYEQIQQGSEALAARVAAELNEQ